MSTSINRQKYIDTARGIGILLVVFGHAFRPGMIQSPLYDLLFRLIYAIHMPLFFVLSGITFGLSYQRYWKQPGKLLAKRATSLLVPLFTYGGLIYLAFFAASKISATASILESAGFAVVSPLRYLYLMLVEENPYASHLWYIWVLFLLVTLSFGLATVCKKSQHYTRIQCWLTLPCLAVALILPLPVMVRKLLAYWFFFALGVWRAERDQASSQASRRLWIAGGVSALAIIGICIAAAFDLFLKTDRALILQNLALAISAVGVIDPLCALCEKWKSARLLPWLGRQSFGIYLFHQPLCGAFLGILLYNLLAIPAPAVLLICTAAGLILPLCILWIGKKCAPIGRLLHFLFRV